MNLAFDRKPLFGIPYAVVDYERAADEIVRHAEANDSFGVSALAVHGLVTALKDEAVGTAVRAIHMVVPDGQPVRWALNLFEKAGMPDRVCGPELTLKVLERADARNLSVYLYGSTPETLERLASFISRHYPRVSLTGIQPDRFREATESEDAEDIRRINASGAHIVLVGRGCPRQELWVAAHIGKVNAAMLAVGAAFDFHAGNLRKAPVWMQRWGLEWTFRLAMEPRRLWRRYLTTNTHFVWLFGRHALIVLFRRGRNRGRAAKLEDRS